MQHARGYEAVEILRKVGDTSQRVVRGEFAYEQDSVGFVEPSPPDRLLKALAIAASAQPNRQLTVLDVGGSLGSQYFRARPFLSPDSIDRWIVCEQRHFVQYGRQHFQHPPLEFVGDIEAAFAESEIDVVVLANVLPYLEAPLDVLRRIANLRPHRILVDRTPLLEGQQDRILVQHTPRSICKSSYPMRLLSREDIRDSLPGYAEEMTVAIAEAPVAHGVLVAPYWGILWNWIDS